MGAVAVIAPSRRRAALHTADRNRALPFGAGQGTEGHPRELSAAELADVIAKARTLRSQSLHGLMASLASATVAALERWRGCARYLHTTARQRHGGHPR